MLSTLGIGEGKAHMAVRKRTLPPGWYPETADDVRALLDGWSSGPPSIEPTGVAAVVPHAGWAFSGRLAFDTLRCLRPSADTVVVVGGHMYPGSGVYVFPEDEYASPLGTIPSDDRLRRWLMDRVEASPDRQADNTVEVQLPFVGYLFPKARVLGMRVEPSERALELGRSLAEASEALGIRLAVVGSTDLTHYGPSYGFMPHGTGKAALQWVREENDRREVDALLQHDFRRALTWAQEHRAACSAGGAVAAGAFAGAVGSTAGHLVGYMTSADIHPGDSFVGYAGIVYNGRATSSEAADE